MTRATTFVDVVRRHASERGDALAYRFLRQEVEVDTLTFAELDRAARAVAATLERWAETPVMLIFPPGLDFVKAFVGCWYARAIPVPWAPPLRPQDVQRALRIAADAGIAAVVTAGAIEPAIRAALDAAGMTEVACVPFEPLLDAGDVPFTDRGVTDQTIALLQYTSGSTSDSKGVVVAHANLAANQRMIERLFEHDQRTSVVGWLPLYHDMGLIGNVLQPLWLGRDVTLMSPIDFVQRPLSWLRAISKYRATTSGGPNFAYEVCAQAAEEEDTSSLDLSCWTLAYNGAEPIRARTLERFAEVLAPRGFRREALYPCYGLAEATLIVTGVPKTAPVTTRRFDRNALARHEAVPSDDEAASVPLVACGRSTDETTVRIVDPETRLPVPPGKIGEVWVSGPAVARGYWKRKEATAEAFGATIAGEPGSFLRTGDFGFFEDGQLYIAGRLKDLLIVRGRNHHPQDVEQTCWESHDALRAGRAAAFTVDDAEERLVIVQELVRDAVKLAGPLDVEEITARVRANVARVHGLTLHRLVLVAPGKVPRTSSGKVRRQECRRLHLENALELGAT